MVRRRTHKDGDLFELFITYGVIDTFFQHVIDQLESPIIVALILAIIVIDSQQTCLLLTHPT